MHLHLNHEELYAIIAFLLGALFGVITLMAWLQGWIFPATVPDYLANNDTLAQNGKAPRTKLEQELPFAWSDRYDFDIDRIGNISYKPKIPYAGDGEG